MYVCTYVCVYVQLSASIQTASSESRKLEDTLGSLLAKNVYHNDEDEAHMRAEVEANVKSRVESLELKNQTLQHQLDDFTDQHQALEQEYKNAVDKLNDAKNDAKMNPTGMHNFIHS